MDAIYIGRGTPHGNPFIVGVHGNRQTCISRFEDYARERMISDPSWLEPLTGKDLLCSCKPRACHGDVLLVLANPDLAA